MLPDGGMEAAEILPMKLFECEIKFMNDFLVFHGENGLKLVEPVSSIGF